MTRESNRPLPAYPQTGVASTCRSYREYADMFALEESQLSEGSTLDVAGGASSFIARLREMGLRGIAADPFYEGDREAVLTAAAKEVEVSSSKISAMRNVYDWSYYGSPERHRQLREESFSRFAADFRSEDAGSRYVAASLPNLPFADGEFRTVVCSHFVFLYGDRFDQAFHRSALEEMLRVTQSGGEVRVYPLVDLNWEICPYIQNIMAWLNPTATAELVPGRLPFIPKPSPVLVLRKR